MIVVDTNVICYHWIRSTHSEAADRALTRDPDWIAPFLWRSEFRNAIAVLVRRNLIPMKVAADIAERAETRLAGREFFVSSRAVMQLVEQSKCSAYDCEFVALAEEQNVPLITVDKQILRDFPQRAISLDNFVRASRRS